MTARHVSRRAVAGSGLALLVLAAAAAGSAKAQELDGELLALCREFHENRQETDAIWENDPPSEGSPEADRSRTLVDRYHYLREELAALPARTPEGLQAKARILLSEFEGEDDEDFPAQYDPRSALTLSLARDLIGRPL